MTDFKIDCEWIPQEGRSESDATLATIRMYIDQKTVSQFEAVRGQPCDLQIPSYYLAEWIAENWWPLLWEPRKNENDGPDAEYLSRHSMLSAQHGFALPKVTIEPAGKSIQVSATRRRAGLADVIFPTGATKTASREEVEGALRSFVQLTVDRLNERRVTESWLQDTWALITETTEDEASFCRLVGALGLSPYDVDEHIAALIETLQPALGDRPLMDLCLTASAADFPAAAKVAQEAFELTRTVNSSTLMPIEKVQIPADNVSVPAYRRGLQAAELLRRKLNIKDTDPRGASRLIDLFEIDTKRQASSSTRHAEDVAVTGAVVRIDHEMKVALLQPTEAKRRFAAARAVFSGWSAENTTESRLLTSAVTRDQQANRAFAAEILAPKAILRDRYRGKKKINQSDIFQLADELQVSPDVIRKQAANNNLAVSLS